MLVLYHLNKNAIQIVFLYLLLIFQLYFFKIFDQLQLIQIFKAETVITTTRKRVGTRRLKNAGLEDLCFALW